MKNKENRASKLNKNDVIGIVIIGAICVVIVAMIAFFFGHDGADDVFNSSSADISSSEAQSTDASELPTSETVSDSVSATDNTTTLPTAPATQNNQQVTEKPVTTTVPTTQGEPTKEEILQKVSEGVNMLKAPDASYVGTKTQNIVIDVTDCTYPAFLTIINSVVKLIANEEVLEYDFTNGKCIDPEENVEVTANDTIPPVGTAFALTIEGVKEAEIKKVGDNTVYSVTLVPETGTFEQPKPTHHGVACDTLDFSLFDVPLGEITKSDFNYPGATVTVTYDKDGRVVGYSEHIDMNGVGEGQALGISASASLEGYIDESWQIVWK